MKRFKDPIINFNLEPPTYAEITKIISKMKSSVLPSPLDQVSVIALRKVCNSMFTSYKNHNLTEIIFQL